MRYVLLGFLLSLTATLSFSTAFARGNENGGGGDQCKSDFMDRVSALKTATQDNPGLLQKFPFLQTVFNTIDPHQNPGFTVEVTDAPIKGCPNTARPIACSVPRLNRVTLYCGDHGWLSLSSIERDKQTLHELLWWSHDYDDSNYFYSKQVVDSLPSFEAHETWQGDGVVLTPAGVQLASYGVTIEVIPEGSVVELKTVFSYDDGTKRTVMQKMNFGASATAFTLESDLGSGSGACYGNGICQMSVSNGAGHAFSTYTHQEQDRLTLLTNETQGAALVYTYREELRRLN
jgi:hypothetical protein